MCISADERTILHYNHIAPVVHKFIALIKVISGILFFLWSSVVIGLVREQNHYHNNRQGHFQIFIIN